MRRIDHPGPAAAERFAAVPGEAMPIRFVLEPGLTVDEAVAEGEWLHWRLRGIPGRQLRTVPICDACRIVRSALCGLV
jgi:hypothetical protein